jgi:hypothetical protein
VNPDNKIIAVADITRRIITVTPFAIVAANI